jgi:uncharacterized protein (DUF885 family)
MLRHSFKIATLLFVLTTGATAAVPDWVAKSNQNAQLLLDVQARFNPEFAARSGLTGYDDKIIDLRADADQRSRAALRQVQGEFEKRLSAETDLRVQQDLQIMLHAIALRIEDSELNEKYFLPFTDVGQLEFNGLRALLNDQIDAKRRQTALIRLKRYAGLESAGQGTPTPLTELAKQRTQEHLANTALLGPFKVELEQSLANTPRYINGIRELFVKYKIANAEVALDALEKQLTEYNAWTRSTVLPHARADFRLPAEVYAHNLKQVGIDIPPDQLIAAAELEFAETRNEMRSLAAQLAKEKGYSSNDYRDVIRELKKKQLGRDAIEPYYKDRIAAIEDIIRREHIVTVPNRPMIMRVASEAESMEPPRLIGNTGERGQFVLPLGVPTGDASSTYDDFTNEAASWTLTAHEGRPGHELQFSSMVENGVSLARSIFAFNSVNVEGWALYAEAEMKPYEPLEGQMIALQARLQRAARAFIDPLLNLGRMTPQQAHDILAQDVVLSEAMVKQEVDRYTFRSPGQATSYFYGYTRLMQLRVETEIALGGKLDRLAYHDFILAQGLLPPDLLRKAVLEVFVPNQLKR